MERKSSSSLTRKVSSLLLLLLGAQCALAAVAPGGARQLRGSTSHADAVLVARQDPPVIDSVESTRKHIKTPPRNKGAFWSGIPFQLSQDAAAASGLQTLEQSVGTEITGHPEAQRGTPTNPQFWDWFSEGFSRTIVEAGHTEVTVLLRAPNRLLTGPSDPYTDGRMVQRSNWSEIEFPIMRENNIRVMALHPGQEGRPSLAPYEIWPNDQGYQWQQEWLGGQEQTEQIQCAPGEDSLLIQCNTNVDEEFEVACPDVPGTIEPPVGGGQCNYTVEAPVNPQDNTFSVTSILTTAAMAFIVSCYNAPSCGGSSKVKVRKPSVLSQDMLARREEVRQMHQASEALVF